MLMQAAEKNACMTVTFNKMFICAAPDTENLKHKHRYSRTTAS